MAIRASGMCGSDIKYYRGPEQRHVRIGQRHRRARACRRRSRGRVLAFRRSWRSPGDRVMVHHYIGCGACAQCRSGWTQMCTKIPVTVLGNNGHGSHAPYLKVPAVDPRQARRPAQLRCRRRHRMWHRNGVGRAEAPGRPRRRDHRDLRPGTGRALGHDAGHSPRREGHRRRPRTQPPQGGHALRCGRDDQPW